MTGTSAMADPHPLSSLLRASASRDADGNPHADPGAASVEPAAFERLLREAVGAARAAWPSVDVPPEIFVPYLAQRLASLSPSGLEEIRVADLYLACACALGESAAIAAFEATFLKNIASSLPKPRRGASIDGDVTQAIREKLLVRRGGAPPKIADYAGRGDLAGWVRVVAVRTALNMMRGQKREVGLDDEAILASKANAGDAEVAHLKRRYRVDFAEAFHAALGTLEPRDRNVLRQHYVDGLTMEQIGTLYKVHRITVVRWVDRARTTLARETKRTLAGKLGVERGELESIMRLIQSQLDVSLRKHLR
jgi:RNA polymerase sigma-70 factor (ECF subfamily)